jgi:hypothetical protein
VLEKVMLPPTVPALRAIDPARVMGPEKEMGWLFVIIDPKKVTGPVPFCA